ncbi:MAG: hypothetical protein E7508_07700 [Ruminococcus sp.]|nr:hypothetical protein [Ruminococcus sp.]
MNNEFTLRPLCTKDIFTLVKIISKFGVKEIKNSLKANSFKNMAGKERYRSAGIAVAFEIFEIAAQKLPECEKEICAFLGSLSGKTAEEIEKQSPVVTVRMIKAVAEKDEFADFFTEISKLFGAEKTE